MKYITECNTHLRCSALRVLNLPLCAVWLMKLRKLRKLCKLRDKPSRGCHVGCHAANARQPGEDGEYIEEHWMAMLMSGRCALQRCRRSLALQGSVDRIHRTHLVIPKQQYTMKHVHLQRVSEGHNTGWPITIPCYRVCFIYWPVPTGNLAIETLLIRNCNDMCVSPATRCILTWKRHHDTQDRVCDMIWWAFGWFVAWMIPRCFAWLWHSLASYIFAVIHIYSWHIDVSAHDAASVVLYVRVLFNILLRHVFSTLSIVSQNSSLKIWHKILKIRPMGCKMAMMSYLSPSHWFDFSGYCTIPILKPEFCESDSGFSSESMAHDHSFHLLDIMVQAIATTVACDLGSGSSLEKLGN